MRLLVIVSRAEYEPWAQALAANLGASQPVILVATPQEAADHIAGTQYNPSHILLDIGARGADILPELDALGEQCETGTCVVAVGDTTDTLLLRELTNRGVSHYLPMPADIAHVAHALTTIIDAPTQSSAPVQSPAPTQSAPRSGHVVVCMNAAAGDGASTVALNIAHAMSEAGQGNTVLVDMDYQFGMVAKNLALKNQYGIADLFDHPERGVDSTLIQRMVVRYGNLDVITAPADLRYMPQVSAESLRQLITTLSGMYDHVVIDLPHVWHPWITATIQQSTHLVLVAQLWLKSVSHAARMMRALRALTIPESQVTAVINRGGAKFKEAIEPQDFERVTNLPIRHTLVNDIKTIVMAETRAKTVMELPPSELSMNLHSLAMALMGLPFTPQPPAPTKRSGLFSKFGG